MPFSLIKSGWVPISLFLMFTFISNIINQHGRILFSVGAVVITAEGLEIAAIRTMRLFLMITGAKILIASTNTKDIVRTLGKFLRPLERIGVPAKDFSETMGLTLKCFPLIKNMASETYKEKMKAEDIRGFRNKAKTASMFLLDMFVKSIQSPEIIFEKADINEKKG
jgi:energy-coupling factor transport system permease protein